MSSYESKVEQVSTAYAEKDDESPTVTKLREGFRVLAVSIINLTDGSRAQSVALTELESAYNWVRAALRQGAPEPAAAPDDGTMEESLGGEEPEDEA